MPRSAERNPLRRYGSVRHAAVIGSEKSGHIDQHGRLGGFTRQWIWFHFHITKVFACAAAVVNVTSMTCSLNECPYRSGNSSCWRIVILVNRRFGQLSVLSIAQVS